MNPRTKYLAGSALVLALAGGAAVVSTGDNAVSSATPRLAGVAAGMHFTDDQGNARSPSAEELAALAAAFQQDLANLTRGRNVPAGEKARGGAVSAVVGVDRIRLLTVNVDENGNARFDHAMLDEDGQVDTESADNWPEM